MNAYKITFSFNECTSKLINNNFTYKSKYHFSKGNYEALNHSLLSINWYCHFSLCKNVHDKWKFFFDTVWESVNLFIPRKKHLHKNKKRIPKYLRKLILKKNINFSVYLKIQKSLYINKSISFCVKGL